MWINLHLYKNALHNKILNFAHLGAFELLLHTKLKSNFVISFKPIHPTKICTKHKTLVFRNIFQYDAYLNIGKEK